jgi:hypothetical protein
MMGRNISSMRGELESDPFRERSRTLVHKPLQLLGARIRFDSNSRELLRLVDDAFAGLPRHRLAKAPELQISLVLSASPDSQTKGRRGVSRGEPPPIALLNGAGLLGGSTPASNFVVLSPRDHAALVVVAPHMLRFPYHIRYELIEFAVYTLAARAQQLVALHAACVGKGNRGLLIMGPSGSGKSTLALNCLLEGFDFLSEDSVFVAPDTLLATGIANFLHVQSDSLRWLDRDQDIARIRRSPVIKRRSGAKKFEVDLRHGAYRLAARPLQIAAIIFLSPESAGKGHLLRRVAKSRVVGKLVAEQAYAAGQPPWAVFTKKLLELPVYELHRGRNPREGVEALRQLLQR